MIVFEMKMAQKTRFPYRNATVVAAESGPAGNEKQSEKTRPFVIFLPFAFTMIMANDDLPRQARDKTLRDLLCVSYYSVKIDPK